MRLLQSLEQFPLLVVLLAIRLQGGCDQRFLRGMLLVERLDKRKTNCVDLEILCGLSDTRLDVLLQFAVPDGQDVFVQRLRLARLQLVQLLQNRFVEWNLVEAQRETDQLDGIVHKVPFDDVDQEVIDDSVPGKEEAKRTKVSR